MTNEALFGLEEAAIRVGRCGRLISVDVFRGITNAGMIPVNNLGSLSRVYPGLAHEKWNGCRPTVIYS